MYVSSLTGVLTQIGGSSQGGDITITSPDSSITVTENGQDFQIKVSDILQSLIQSALQPGNNVSELVNDAGYLTELGEQFQTVATDSYVGDRLVPVDANINGLLINKNSNTRNGFEAVNINAGNGATSSIVARGSANLYEKSISMQWFGSGYFVPYLRDKGAITSTNDIVIAPTNNTGVDFKTGSTISTLTTKMKLDGDGTLNIITQPITDNTVTKGLARKSDGKVVEFDIQGETLQDLQSVTDEGQITTNSMAIIGESKSFNVNSDSSGDNSAGMYLEGTTPKFQIRKGLVDYNIYAQNINSIVNRQASNQSGYEVVSVNGNLADSNGNVLVSAGGNFIPLTGTTEGNPVTGDIEMYNPANDDSYKISASDDFSVYRTSDGKGFGMNSTGINFNFDEDSKGIQGSFLYDKQDDPNAFAQMGDLNIKVSKGLISGDSTIAAYLGQNAVASYILTFADISAGTTLTDIAVPGHTITQQKANWLALTDQNTYDWIIVEIGLNDTDDGETVSGAISKYQDYIDTINLTRKASSKLIIGTMTPCRAVAGIDYSVWLGLNEAIMGGGATPITGVDIRVNNHTLLLSDVNDNLLPAYDMGDHIHENNLARNVIGWSYRRVLRDINYIPQSSINTTEKLTSTAGGYVDLINNQTIAGEKSFTDTLLYKVGSQSVGFGKDGTDPVLLFNGAYRMLHSAGYGTIFNVSPGENYAWRIGNNLNIEMHLHPDGNLANGFAYNVNTGEKLQINGDGKFVGKVSGLDAVLPEHFVPLGQLSSNTLSSASSLALLPTSKVMYYSYTGATATTWTLPTIASNSRTRFVLINTGTGTITLNSSSGGNDIWDSGTVTNTYPISPGSSMELFNNGNSYIIL